MPQMDQQQSFDLSDMQLNLGRVALNTNFSQMFEQFSVQQWFESSNGITINPSTNLQQTLSPNYHYRAGVDHTIDRSKQRMQQRVVKLQQQVEQLQQEKTTAENRFNQLEQQMQQMSQLSEQLQPMIAAHQPVDSISSITAKNLKILQDNHIHTVGMLANSTDEQLVNYGIKKASANAMINSAAERTALKS